MMAESPESEHDSDILQPGPSHYCDHCEKMFSDQTSLLRHQETIQTWQERNEITQLSNTSTTKRTAPENDANAVYLSALNKRIIELDKNDFEKSELFERYAKYTKKKRMHKTKYRNGDKSEMNEVIVTNSRASEDKNSHALEDNNDLLVEMTTKEYVPTRKRRRSSSVYSQPQNDSLSKDTGNIPTPDMVENISKNSDPRTTTDKVKTNREPKKSSNVNLKQKQNKSFIDNHTTDPEIKNIVSKNDELKRLVANLATYFGHSQEAKKRELSRNLYKCKTCQLHFPTAADLRKHVKEGIHKDKEIECEYCLLKFSKKTWLNHLEVHEPKKMTKKDFDIVTLVTDSSDISSDDDDIQTSASIIRSETNQEQNVITETLTLTTNIPHTVKRSVASKEGSVANNETKEDGDEKEMNISMNVNTTENTNVVTKVLRSGVVRMNAAEHDNKEKKTIKEVKVKKKDPASKICYGVLFKCVLCDEHFITKKRFDKHMAHNRHIKENKHASYCQSCNYKFNNVQTMANHVNFHHRKQKLKRGDLKIITSVSGRDRPQPNQLELVKTEGSRVATKNIVFSKTQRPSKITDILYKCGHCDSHFVSFNPMASHLHRNCKTKNKILSKRFKCEKCDLMFSHNSLTQHESIQHKKLGLNRGDFRFITKEPNDVVDDDSGEITTSGEHIIGRKVDNIFGIGEVTEGDKNDDNTNNINLKNPASVKNCMVTLAPIDISFINSLDTSREEGVKSDEEIDISEDDLMDIDPDVVHSALEITSPFYNSTKAHENIVEKNESINMNKEKECSDAAVTQNTPNKLFVIENVSTVITSPFYNNTEAHENIVENNESNNMIKEKECSDAAVTQKTPNKLFVRENVSTVIETNKNCESVPSESLKNAEQNVSEQNKDRDVIVTVPAGITIKRENESFISRHLIFDD